MIALLLALSCGSSAPPRAEPEAGPEPIGMAECAVCGMVVREQPAPRGQVLHHDGTRAFACSIGDLRALISMPSPHGSVEQTWVEVLPADLGLDQLGKVEYPWLPADQAHYVAGIERPLVMGVPTLSYATAQGAELAAERTGGQRTTWTKLRQTPFHEVPGE